MAEANPIRTYRAKRGYTLRQLATEIGVQPNTVWRWEQGRVPDPEMWPAIIKATGITRPQLIRFATTQKYSEASAA